MPFDPNSPRNPLPPLNDGYPDDWYVPPSAQDDSFPDDWHVPPSAQDDSFPDDWYVPPRKFWAKVQTESALRSLRPCRSTME